MRTWKEILDESEEYDECTILDNPMPFNEVFKNMDFDVVSVHSLQVYTCNDNDNIIGFIGNFKWKNNEITSLDGDNYSDKVLVYGYDMYTTDEGKTILTILVNP